METFYIGLNNNNEIVAAVINRKNIGEDIKEFIDDGLKVLKVEADSITIGQHWGNKSGVELITDERKRQIDIEGWDEKHDNQHLDYDLASVGALYALHTSLVKNPNYSMLFEKVFSYWYPWDKKWWKPTPNDPIRQLVKAGALIAAEIDRLQRQSDKMKLIKLL